VERGRIEVQVQRSVGVGNQPEHPGANQQSRNIYEYCFQRTVQPQ